MSLRVRLTAGLLAVAGVAMLVVGIVTYAGQRSFLLDRVDDQAHAAFEPVARALDGEGGRPFPGAGGRGRPPVGGPGVGLGGRREGRPDGRGPRGGPGRSSACRRAPMASAATRAAT